MKTDTPLTDATIAAMPESIEDHARSLERKCRRLDEFLDSTAYRLHLATKLLTRARNGPGVTLPYELYEDIQNFLNAP